MNNGPAQVLRTGACAMLVHANKNWTTLKKIQVFVNKDRHNDYGAIGWKKTILIQNPFKMIIKKYRASFFTVLSTF